MTPDAAKDAALEALWSRFKHWIDKDDPLDRQVRTALAAGSGTAKTAKPIECEASQSGAEGNRPKDTPQ